MNRIKLNGKEYEIVIPYKLNEEEKEEIEVELNRKWDLFYWYSYSQPRGSYEERKYKNDKWIVVLMREKKTEGNKSEMSIFPVERYHYYFGSVRTLMFSLLDKLYFLKKRDNSDMLWSEGENIDKFLLKLNPAIDLDAQVEKLFFHRFFAYYFITAYTDKFILSLEGKEVNLFVPDKVEVKNISRTYNFFP